MYRISITVFYVAIVANVNASPLIDYEEAPSREPASVENVCNKGDVIDALKGQFLIPPLDPKVRGLSVRIPAISPKPLVGTYGLTRKYPSGLPKFHAGTDLLAKQGENVLAVIAGKVLYAGQHYNKDGSKGKLGNFIKVETQIGVPPVGLCNVIMIYAHLKRIAPTIKSGKEILDGQMIGEVGRVGYDKYKSIPTHLHVELWVNEYNFSKAREYSADLMKVF